MTAPIVFSIVSAVKSFFMFRDALLKALVPVTLITFTGIIALAPLYVTLGVMTRQVKQPN